MIHYALRCTAGHAFEGWFRSSADFDAQAGGGLLACPHCGSTEVSRGLMAPAVVSRSQPKAAAEAPPPAVPSAGEATGGEAAQPMVLTDPRADPRAAAFAEMLRRLRRHVETHSDYVGDRFAEEARKIHFGETDPRGIYGEASRDEVEQLIEDGVDVHPLPLLPEDRN